MRPKHGQAFNQALSRAKVAMEKQGVDITKHFVPSYKVSHVEEPYGVHAMLSVAAAGVSSNLLFFLTVDASRYGRIIAKGMHAWFAGSIRFPRLSP
jgi:hypothetical protein